MMTRAAVCVAACLLAGVKAADEAPRWATEGLNFAPAGGVGGDSIGSGRRGLSFSLLHNGSPAWVDLPGSMLTDPPLAITGVATGVPELVVPAKSVTTFTCPGASSGLGHSQCNAWVWVYNCHWSCPTDTDKIVTPELLSNGWDRTMCAPKFLNGAIPYKHRMVGHRYRLSPGETVKFIPSGDVKNVAFGIELAEDCAALVTKDACLASNIREKCQWSTEDSYPGTCVPTTCTTPGQGPPPPCAACSLDGTGRDD